MALNLLGSHSQEDAKKAQEKVKMYVPREQKTVKPQKEAKPQPVANVQPVEEGKRVDLAEKFLHREALMKRLSFVGVAILIIFLVVGAGVAFYLRPVTPKLVINQPPVVVLTPQPTPVVNEVPPVPVPTPVINEVPPAPIINEPAGPLPDTELAPLRGSLVKFSTTNDIYLIENNGELRLVNQQTVVFKNGQKLNELDRGIIYQLLDRWQTVRKGDKIVEGQVDFDPRVMTLSELLPFIQ
jgi:hypothetical protein